MKNALKYTISRRKNSIISVEIFNLMLTLFTTPSFKMTYAYMSASPSAKILATPM